ncbi:MAG: hypothetical protein Q8N02_00350 [Methylotenera sp.]|nr:hypothetical protein [Methylotenera sp.]MDP3094019.1 hypothetical protein [Methylotenera sp.]
MLALVNTAAHQPTCKSTSLRTVLISFFMVINITKVQIDNAIPKIADGIKKYISIQKQLTSPNIFKNAAFRKEFNHFYRVRRGAAWQDDYFALMALAQKNQLQFKDVIDLLYKATERYEASFASKLVATLVPTSPIIDAWVLKNVGLRLPYSYETNRAAKITNLYLALQACFTAFLKTTNGRYLVSEFKRVYPTAGITEEKMVDLVLWQTR